MAFDPNRDYGVSYQESGPSYYVQDGIKYRLDGTPVVPVPAPVPAEFAFTEEPPAEETAKVETPAVKPKGNPNWRRKA